MRPNPARAGPAASGEALDFGADGQSCYPRRTKPTKRPRWRLHRFDGAGAYPLVEAIAVNILLWVLQALLALAFFAHGWMMLAPPPSVAELMNASLPRWFQVFLGVAEVSAAVGLILPGLARVMPSLVPSAAAGIMLVMFCATIYHVSRGEFSSAAVTVVLLATATFVAYARWRVAPSVHASVPTGSAIASRARRTASRGRVPRVHVTRLRQEKERLPAEV